MKETSIPRIGFTCAYTPLAMIDAAGYAPYRLLPIEDHKERSGQFLHDNLCPHVKEVLNIALSGHLPELEGVVFINSCDAMRRLADGWQTARPNDRLVILDLPATVDDPAKRFFATELKRLMKTLLQWSGCAIPEVDFNPSVKRYNTLCNVLGKLNGKVCAGRLKGGTARMQEIYNQVSRQTIEKSLEMLQPLSGEPELENTDNEGVPIFLFGNVLPNPQAFKLFESCGARIAGHDFCTGTRMFQPMESINESNVYLQIASGLLERMPCARTFSTENPGKIARDVIESARACGARGVIGHTLKFCDPYLARVPVLREELKTAGFPFLFLEGDCTLRPMGQQRTRIEAFIEMLR